MNAIIRNHDDLEARTSTSRARTSSSSRTSSDLTIDDIVKLVDHRDAGGVDMRPDPGGRHASRELLLSRRTRSRSTRGATGFRIEFSGGGR